jgi:hypothetical protein
VVFARRLRHIQRAIVEIGDASSGFLQFVAMAFRGDQRSKVVSDIATLARLSRPERISGTWPAPRTVAVS